MFHGPDLDPKVRWLPRGGHEQSSEDQVLRSPSFEQDVPSSQKVILVAKHESRDCYLRGQVSYLRQS